MLQNQFLSLSSISRLTEVKAKFARNVLSMGSFFMLLYTIIYYQLQANLAALTCGLTLTLVVPIILYSIYIKKLMLARYLTIITTVCVVAISSIALRNSANTEYYFLPAMMLSLLLFEPDQKNAIAFGLFFPILGWVCTHIDTSFLEKTEWLPPSDFPYNIVSMTNFVGAIVLTFTFLKFYSQAMLKSKEIEIDNEQKLMLSSKLVSMGQLAGGLAHEVNNPLSIILGRTQLLKAKLETSSTEQIDKTYIIQNLEKIESTATLITKIIRGLNAFSRNSENDPLEKTSVIKSINHALDLCEEKIKQHQIQVRTQYEKDIEIQCREFQLTQVIVNLVNNSIDAIEPLSEKWVLIDFHENSHSVFISVTDSGHGIDPSLREKMMIPFYTTKEIGKGIGLGLSISKTIIEAHGGQLTYNESSPHTQFTIQLPTNSFV